MLFISTWRSIEVDRFRRCPNASHFQFREEYRWRRWFHVSIIHHRVLLGTICEREVLWQYRWSTVTAMQSIRAHARGWGSRRASYLLRDTHSYAKIFSLITPQQRGEQHQRHQPPTSTYSSTYCRTSCSILYVWQVHTRYIIGHPSNHTSFIPILPAESEVFGGGELGSVSPLSSPLRSPARSWFKQSWLIEPSSCNSAAVFPGVVYIWFEALSPVDMAQHERLAVAVGGV